MFSMNWALVGCSTNLPMGASILSLAEKEVEEAEVTCGMGRVQGATTEVQVILG